MAATCSPRGEYKPTDSMTELARARWRARYSYKKHQFILAILFTKDFTAFAKKTPFMVGHTTYQKFTATATKNTNLYWPYFLPKILLQLLKKHHLWLAILPIRNLLLLLQKTPIYIGHTSYQKFYCNCY